MNWFHKQIHHICLYILTPPTNTDGTFFFRQSNYTFNYDLINILTTQLTAEQNHSVSSELSSFKN